MPISCRTLRQESKRTPKNYKQPLNRRHPDTTVPRLEALHVVAGDAARMGDINGVRKPFSFGANVPMQRRKSWRFSAHNPSGVSNIPRQGCVDGQAA